MQFVHVPPARIEREWPDIAEILAPALRQDPGQTIEGLHKRLAKGAESLLEITGPGRCLMVVEVTNDLACWVKWFAGHIDGGPKARARIIRQAIDHIERFARSAGCTELRLCGRDWSPLLPEFKPLAGHRNGLTKELQ